VSLSRLKQGFDSPRERQHFQVLSWIFVLSPRRVSNFSPTAESDFATIQLCMKAHAQRRLPEAARRLGHVCSKVSRQEYA
jgi:hypothetical protein